MEESLNTPPSRKEESIYKKVVLPLLLRATNVVSPLLMTFIQKRGSFIKKFHYNRLITMGYSVNNPKSALSFIH